MAHYRCPSTFFSLLSWPVSSTASPGCSCWVLVMLQYSLKSQKIPLIILYRYGAFIVNVPNHLKSCFLSFFFYRPNYHNECCILRKTIRRLYIWLSNNLGFDMNQHIFLVVIDRTPVCMYIIHIPLCCVWGKKDILAFFKVIDLISCYLVAWSCP